MYQKYHIRYLAAALALLLLLSGCRSNGESAATTSSSSGSASVSSAEIDTEFSAKDLDVGYEDSTATHITLSGASASVSGEGASVSGTAVTIKAAGTYVLSGTLDNGRVLVEAGKDDKIQLVFLNVSIHCSNYAPVYIKQADKVFLTLPDGTKNSLSDGADYQLAEADSTVNGAIFSKADLTINGKGALTVNASCKHGIVSKDDLVITGGTIAVTANGKGLSGKDCVKIAGGAITLKTVGDGIQSDCEDDAQKGYVYIKGGTFHINAQTDGIQAETVLRIDGGSFEISTAGGSANASTSEKGGDRPGWGGKQEASASTAGDDTASTKGLKSGSELVINAGTYQVDSLDDSLHTNGTMTIAGGDFTLKSGDDGMHADGAVTITAGKIDIQKSYEGIEGSSVTIQGGEIQVEASDDAINAAGGNDGSSLGGRPGQNSFDEDADIFIRISGGSISISASGDGIDSNGNFFMEGGTVFVDGPTSGGDGALDYDGIGKVTGGTIVAVGSSGMAQGFSEDSTQCSLLYNFSTTLSAGDKVTLTDGNGKEVAAYTPKKQYQSVVISTPALEKGETYTLKAGSQSAEITLDSVVTSNGKSGGMMGGGGRPGR